MMILEDTIDIQADRATVWRVTVDVEAWPQWSPAMQRVVRQDAGEFELGSCALIKQPLMPETRWMVTEIDKGHSFTWSTQVMGMHMIATHLILPRDSGVTSVLKLEMKGGIARLLWSLLKFPVLRALKAENRGLKKFCESGQ